MMEATLLQQGINLMLYGMGVVFTFLALLIAATSFMSLLVQRFSREEPAPATLAVGVKNTSGADDQLVAVISAAIHKYRSRHKR